jgi:hypothetical protein
MGYIYNYIYISTMDPSWLIGTTYLIWIFEDIVLAFKGGHRGRTVADGWVDNAGRLNGLQLGKS